MTKRDRSREASVKNYNEGSAARTRPFSFEEIMSRRKKKLLADVKERVSETRDSSEKGDAGGALAHSEFDGGHKSMENPKGKVKGNSKKVEDLLSKKERDIFEDKSKPNYDLEASMKLKSSYSKGSRDKESKNEKQSHHRSRTSNRSGGDTEKESEKKRPKNSAENITRDEVDKKSGKEAKRKHHNHTDDRTRPEKGSNLKKHDSERMRDAEYSQRKDRKKEHSQAYYEEPRPQSRRSRSREYNRERDRSVSKSPRSHKRPYYGRDYEESSFYSSKDKSRRKYSDGDKFRTSGNGGYSSGHYRKRGSGLGGYSPRKRRSEAAVKTPSPTIRSPERKSTTWDQPPAGTSNVGSGSTLGTFQPSASKMLELISSIPITPAASKPQPEPSVDTRLTVINSSIDSVQLTHATRPMRRLYVENLPPSASEKSVTDCLNDFLLSSGVNCIQGAKPCISCIINKEKSQALVEFLTPEDATTALSFDGRSLSGFVLKIRRPKDFVGAATGAPEKTVPVVKAISDVVRDSPHKIFIGGISEALSSEMVMEIVTAFGLLRSYHFEFNEELHGPCAFLEYEDHSITLKACAGLDGMKLGGRILTAVQAFPDFNGEEGYAEKSPSYGIPIHAKPLLVDSTQVLQLKNVLDHEEFLRLSEAEVEEMLEDIRLECARFGTIKSVNIVKYNSHCEGSTEASECQDPVSDLASKIEARAESPSSNSKKNGDASPLYENEEIQDSRLDTECPQSTDEKPVEECGRKEPTDLFPVDGAKDLRGGHHHDIDKDLDVEGSINVGNGMVSEMSEEEEIVKLAETGDMNIATVDKAEASSGDGELKRVEQRNLNEAGATTNGDGDCQANGPDDFEPGCVLVEFLRKEAACIAAHCLHGRSYGERIVSASYVPQDVYLARFPR